MGRFEGMDQLITQNERLLHDVGIWNLQWKQGHAHSPMFATLELASGRSIEKYDFQGVAEVRHPEERT